MVMDGRRNGIRTAATAALLFFFGCAGLPPLRRATASCSATTTDALWKCVGEPDPRPRESAFTSTARLANGDLIRRLLLNQVPSLACNTTPWSGFKWIDVQAGAVPLKGFLHEGDPAKAVVIVVHGIFDSNTNRYVRYTASALAEDGFTVVVPDMRWHGCQLARPALATAGIDETADLSAWAAALRRLYPRPVGLLGFSLGALDVINAAARTSDFAGGVVAISPPASLSRVIGRLDAPPGFRELGVNKFFLIYFRTVLRVRNRRLGIPFWARAPFHTYLDHVARTHSSPFASTAEELMDDVDPAARLRDVRHPLLILAAKNDPVMTTISSDALVAAANGNPLVHIVVSDEGGHTGIIGRDSQWFSDAIAVFFENARKVP
jgi:predicted alpha/beta-fold hydrolase